MASDQPTNPAIRSEESEYASLTAQQAAGRFLGRHRLIMAASVVAAPALLVACVVWAGPNIEHPEAFAFYAVVFLAVIALAVYFNTRNFNGFLGILHTDFDPRKMLGALSIVMEKRKGKKREQGTYAMLYAQCSQQLGYDDIALQWVEHAERDSKLRMVHRILGCNVRANAARHDGDYEELARIRGQAEALIRASGRAGKRGAQVLAWMDFDLALDAGDWVRCNEAIGAMRATATTPLQKLSLDVETARLAEAQGNLALAREHFASVAARGGGSRAARDAAAWLASHPAER